MPGIGCHTACVLGYPPCCTVHLRAGVHTVILPKENEKDLDEIDPLVREKLRFVPVETVDAVFAEALVLPEKCTAAAHESYLPPVQESAHSALRAGEMS